MDDVNKKISLTVLLPAGRLPLDIMAGAQKLAHEHDLGIYLSTAQNLRLLNVPEQLADEVKQELAALGAEFKGPGKFPLPRVCIGKPHCNFGLVDTEALNKKILDKFSDKGPTKAKFKISIAGCPLGCSGTMVTDISIMATRAGFEVFAGGKGGPNPKVGRRIKRKASENEVLDIIATLVDFHDRKTKKKQRMFKLLSDPEFPFPEV